MMQALSKKTLVCFFMHKNVKRKQSKQTLIDPQRHQAREEYFGTCAMEY